MDFSVDKKSNTVVVICVGETLDFSNAFEFRTTYEELIGAGFLFFVLDFSNAETLDSEGLGEVYTLHRQLKETGGQVIFAAPSKAIMTVINASHTYKAMRLQPTVETALHVLAVGQ